MIGQISFQHQQYHEVVILEEGDVQLILCLDGEQFKLYRLSAPETPLHNRAYYTSAEAVTAYQGVVAWAALQAVPSYCERDLSSEWTETSLEGATR